MNAAKLLPTNSFSLHRLAETGDEPVSLSRVKAHCRVDFDDDDDLLTALISAARMQAEAATGLALVDSQWELTLDRFPGHPHLCFDSLRSRRDHYAIRFPRSPVTSVDFVTYYDVANEQQTLPADVYDFDGERIAPVLGQRWPATRPGIAKVAVTFTTAADTDGVPLLLKQAILLTVASWYANREDVVISTGQVQTLPRAAEHIFALYKTSHVGFEVAA